MTQPTADHIVRVYERLADIPRAAWDALVDPQAAGALFLRWDFLQALEESGCVAPEAGWQPLHLTVWAADRLVAAAPTYIKGHSQGEFVFDWQWADVAERLGIQYYPKLVVAAPLSPVTGPRRLVLRAAPQAEQAVLYELLGESLKALCQQLGTSSAHVLFPPEDEPPALAEQGLLRRVGVQFHWRNEGYRSFDEFLARFPSKKRHMIRRERAEVRKAGLVVTTRRGPFTPDEVRAMHRCYASTVDKFYWGRRYLNQRFFELLAERMPDCLEFVTARAGAGPEARLVAGAVNLCGGGRLYGRYWGHNLESTEPPEPPSTQETPDAADRFLHFEVCYYHSIEECIARGLSAFEPGAGGEHKLARGFLPTLTYSAHYIRDGRLRRVLADFLVREEAAIRQGVAQALADGPLRAGVSG